MKSFLFYDLETSGIQPRVSRIMQFAAIRTDMDLNQIGEPYNVMVKMTDDVLPDPGAIMVTGITPQQTLADGYTEAEFCRFLMDEICTPDTTIAGYNSVRFDDEFIRHLFWRNFYDPYEWCWLDGRGRWDLLDVVRMTRALRPDGIEWPVSPEGKPVNKLESISKANGLTHTKAHDALSDVEDLIGVAKLIKATQPKLYDYLYRMKDKKSVQSLVSLTHPEPFVYSSGRYDSRYQSTTVAYPIAQGSKPGSVLVYDLRHDPSRFVRGTSKALASVLFANREMRQQDDFVPVPVKELSFNKCPAVAPLGVLDAAAQTRLQIDLDMIKKHRRILDENQGFGTAIREAFALREPFQPSDDVEAKLYDGFVPEKDKSRMAVVRGATEKELADFTPTFTDERLAELLLRYKARNFPASLSESEVSEWEMFKSAKLKAALPSYLDQLHKLALAQSDTFLLEELQLWAESILPADI